MAVTVFWAGLGLKSFKMMDGLKMQCYCCVNMLNKFSVLITP
jgi:hypothetical protein